MESSTGAVPVNASRVELVLKLLHSRMLQLSLGSTTSCEQMFQELASLVTDASRKQWRLYFRNTDVADVASAGAEEFERCLRDLTVRAGEAVRNARPVLSVTPALTVVSGVVMARMDSQADEEDESTESVGSVELDSSAVEEASSATTVSVRSVSSEVRRATGMSVVPTAWVRPSRRAAEQTQGPLDVFAYLTESPWARAVRPGSEVESPVLVRTVVAPSASEVYQSAEAQSVRSVGTVRRPSSGSSRSRRVRFLQWTLT